MECHGVRLEGSALALFRVFAEKIGWMAELGAKRITGIATIKGDAEDWLLSPVGADAVRAVDETAKPDHIAALVEGLGWGASVYLASLLITSLLGIEDGTATAINAALGIGTFTGVTFGKLVEYTLSHGVAARRIYSFGNVHSQLRTS